MVALLSAVLLCFVPLSPVAVHHRVDVLEHNRVVHIVDPWPGGKPQIDTAIEQWIVWEIGPDGLRVQDWKMVSPRDVLVLHPDGGATLTSSDGHHVIRATSFRRTASAEDPERVDRMDYPESRRRVLGLRLPNEWRNWK